MRLDNAVHCCWWNMINSASECSSVEPEWSTSRLRKSVMINTVQTTSVGSRETADTEVEAEAQTDTKCIRGLDDMSVRFFQNLS